MVAYRRHFVPGGTYFFTLTLLDPRAKLLVEHVDALRHAFRTTVAERPFAIEAIAVLPEHLHALLALPAGDADFPARWRRIKALFTRGLVVRGVPLGRNRKGEYDLWQRRYWEHTIQDPADLERHVDYIHFNPVRQGLVARTRGISGSRRVDPGLRSASGRR
jgi:putative transposase